MHVTCNASIPVPQWDMLFMYIMYQYNEVSTPAQIITASYGNVLTTANQKCRLFCM